MIEYTVKVYDDHTEWYHNNLLDRAGAPAVEWKAGPKFIKGAKEYWQNGKRHRVDGPAMITENGDEFWFFEGMLHRKDGPAVRYADGRLEYWNHGERILEDGD